MSKVDWGTMQTGKKGSMPESLYIFHSVSFVLMVVFLFADHFSWPRFPGSQTASESLLQDAVWIYPGICIWFSLIAIGRGERIEATVLMVIEAATSLVVGGVATYLWMGPLHQPGVWELALFDGFCLVILALGTVTFFWGNRKAS